MSSQEQKTRRRINQLAQRECANYDNGTCLLPMYGGNQSCYEVKYTDPPCSVLSDRYNITDGAIACDWFLEAVLPLDKELHKEVWQMLYANVLRNESDTLRNESGHIISGHRKCGRCGKVYLPNNNRQQYCTACRGQRRKIKQAEWVRNKRFKNP